MKIKKFIYNSFKFFKKTTPEELHIKYLLENNEYSKVYELFQNGVNFSKIIEYDLPYYFLNFLNKNYKTDTDTRGYYVKDSNNNYIRRIAESSLEALKEFKYFFKLLNASRSIKESFLKTLSEGLSENLRNKDPFGYDSYYGNGVHAFYNYIMGNVTSNEDVFNKNTTDLNIEFFKFIRPLLEEPNKLPKIFMIPKEFVYLYLLENTITKTSDLDKLLKISDLYPFALLRPTNEDNNSLISKNNMIKYFKELRYNVEQAKIQKLPFIGLTSDGMQLKLIKSTVKPQILDINQIQGFIDSHDLSEDIKKSLTLIASTLNYLNSENLPSEEQHVVDNIKQALYQNLNDYDNFMEILDNNVEEYKLSYVDMATKLSQILLNYEKSKIKSLEQTQQITKVRLK